MPLFASKILLSLFALSLSLQSPVRATTLTEPLLIDLPADKASIWDLHIGPETEPEKIDPAPTSWLKLESGPFNGSPELAGWLNTLFPGAGYLYINEPGKALLAAPLIIPMLAPYYFQAETYQTNIIKIQSLYLSNFTNQYLSYDTYQTALDKLGRPDRVLDIPHYSFLDLYLAPLNPNSYWSEHWQSNLFRYGFLGLATLLMGILIASRGIHPDASLERGIWIIPSLIAFSTMVSVGEESFYRGLVQPTASELTQTAWAGNLIQATYFGLSHTNLGARFGITTQPFGLSLLAARTSPIDYSKDYQLPVSSIGQPPAGATGELLNFSRTFAVGWMLGWMLEQEAETDGMLRNVTLHAYLDSISFISAFLLEGNVGPAGLMIRIPY